MKKSAKKTKPAKRKSSKNETPDTQLPDLVSVMFKLTERLEVVERKLDLVLSHTSNRQHQPSRPSFQQNQPPRQEPRPPQPQNFNRHAQNPQYPHPNQNQNRGQNNRPMFQTTCAECGKGCEVPFKPTGERPIYCKECFALRKGGSQSHKPHHSSNPVSLEKRELKVVKNGVGRTVISEMVAVNERQKASGKKPSKPAKKSRR